MNATPGSLVLRALDAHAISPSAARSLVAKLRAASEEQHPGDAAAAHEDRIADQIIRRYAKMTAVAGAAAALPGAIPGVGTIVAMVGGGSIDFISSMKLQVDMCRCLAECYGHDLSAQDANNLTMVLALAAKLEGLGGAAASDLASKAGGHMLREHLKGPVVESIKHMLSKVGVALTRKSLLKGIPFGVGMAVGSGLNYTLTRYVGKLAKGYFRTERDFAAGTARLQVN